MTRKFYSTSRHVTPGQVEQEMAAIKKITARVDALADKVTKVYAEATDAGHQQGSGDGVAMGRSGFRVSDPTGDIAVSGLHAFLRSKVRHAASKLRKVEEPLEEVERILAEAFSAYDPEHRQRLARLKELETTAVSYQHAKKA